MDTWVSGLLEPPKCPTIIQSIELGKPFVVLKKVGTLRRELQPQVVEETAKREGLPVTGDIEAQNLPQCESMQTCRRSRK
jgi:hypothetical protein